MGITTKDISNLLKNVNLIKKKYDEILDATGGRFNIFRSCGVNHYENTHSAILAEFLKPDGTHGLKSKLLEYFIENLDEGFNIQNFNFENSRVHKEYPTKEGRIDILIEDNQNKAIIIENKIYAGDQWEQLKRYERFAINKYGKENFQILYLSLDGKDASEQSGKDVLYFPISYETTIINWLEKCVAIASRFPMVRETIIQYINHLKELTNKSSNNEMEQEIKTFIFQNEQNFNIAKKIANLLGTGLGDYRVERFFSQLNNNFSPFTKHFRYKTNYHLFDKYNDNGIIFKFDVVFKEDDSVTICFWEPQNRQDNKNVEEKLNFIGLLNEFTSNINNIGMIKKFSLEDFGTIENLDRELLEFVKLFFQKLKS